MEKNGEKLSIKLENFTGNAILPKYGYISEIGVEADYYTSNITFPGGISMGDDGSKIESVYLAIWAMISLRTNIHISFPTMYITMRAIIISA